MMGDEKRKRALVCAIAEGGWGAGSRMCGGITIFCGG